MGTPQERPSPLYCTVVGPRITSTTSHVREGGETVRTSHPGRKDIDEGWVNDYDGCRHRPGWTLVLVLPKLGLYSGSTVGSEGSCTTTMMTQVEFLETMSEPEEVRGEA